MLDTWVSASFFVQWSYSSYIPHCVLLIGLCGWKRMWLSSFFFVFCFLAFGVFSSPWSSENLHHFFISSSFFRLCGWWLIVCSVGRFWVSYLTPYSYPIHLSSFFVHRSCKRIKDEMKKTGIPLYSIFILGFMTILWWKCFPELVEIVAFLRQSIEVYYRSSFGGSDFWRGGIVGCLYIYIYIFFFCKLL